MCRARRPVRQRPCYVTGTPDPRPRAVDREAARAAARDRAGRAGPADLRRLAGRPAVQRRRGRGAADASSRRVTVIHVAGERRLRRCAGRSRGAARGAPQTATGRTRSCARRCSPPWPRRTSSSGGPARRRWPRRPPSACRWSSSRTRTRRATSVRTPASSSRPGRRGSSTTRRSTPTRCSRRPRLLDDPAPHIRDVRRGARALGRPGAADAVAELVLAAAERRPLPMPRPSSADRRRHVTAEQTGPPDGDRPRSTPIAAGHRHPAPDRRQDVARRAAGAVHDDARRWAGGPVRDRPQRLRAARPRPVRARHAACRTSSSAAAATWSSADRGGPRARDPEPRRGHPSRGERYTAEAGVPMARAATETQRAGLTGLEFGLAIPGTVGGAVWANAGAHESDVAGVLESRARLLADGRETVVPRGRAGARLPRQPLQARPGRVAVARARPGRDVPPRRPRTRTSSRAGSTTSAAGARRTSRSACPRRAACSATRPAIRPGG